MCAPCVSKDRNADRYEVGDARTPEGPFDRHFLISKLKSG